MTNTEFQNLPSGNAINAATDTLIAVRSGSSTDVQVIPGGPNWINVQSFGMLFTNTAAVNGAAWAAKVAALVAASVPGATFYFPSGGVSSVYLVDRPLIIANSSGSNFDWFRLVGDGYLTGGGPASMIEGNFSGPLIQADWQPAGANGTLFIENLALFQLSSNSAAYALYLSGGNSCVIEKVSVSCPNIAIVDYGSVSSHYICPKLNGSGALGVGIAVHSGGGCLIDTPDASGWSEALRLCGPGVSVLGGRTESNHIALSLGTDVDGTSFPLDRSFIGGISGEANDYGLGCYNASGCTFAAISMGGSSNAPSGQSITGLVVSGGANCNFLNCNFSGGYTTQAAAITGNNFLNFSNCSASNTLSPFTEGLVNSGMDHVTLEDCSGFSGTFNIIPVTFGCGRSAVRAVGLVPISNLTGSSAIFLASVQLPSSVPDGTYEVGGQINISAASAVSLTLVVSYHDALTNTGQTLTLPLYGSAGTPVASATIIGTGIFTAPKMLIQCKAGTAITPQLVGTYVGLTGSAVGIVEQLS